MPPAMLRVTCQIIRTTVIGLSAAALARDTTRAKDAGFHRYLTKPVKVDELTETLERLLEG